MVWNSVRSTDDVDSIIVASYHTPQILFKHSTRCFISSMVKNRFEDKWSYTEKEFTAHFLDIFSFRKVSNYVAERLSVHHESPQLIMIHNGETIFDASHHDIYAEELRTIILN
jgi:bacillithiol system protein YtxJ